MNKTFDDWWAKEGSGMPPLANEDAETHTRRVCEIAWRNAVIETRREILSQARQRATFWREPIKQGRNK